MTLVSPNEVLQEWDLGRSGGLGATSFPPDGDGAGDSTSSIGTHDTLSAGRLLLCPNERNGVYRVCEIGQVPFASNWLTSTRATYIPAREK